MPAYTIETACHAPTFRLRTYHASTLALACRLAVEDTDWNGAKRDHETVGETFVSGVWQGEHAPGHGDLLPVPSQFRETVQRKAEHFEIMFGVLKILATDIRTGRPTQPHWRDCAERAVAKAEAILAGARDPENAGSASEAGGQP